MTDKLLTSVDECDRLSNTMKRFSFRRIMMIALCVALTMTMGLAGCSGASAEDAIESSLTAELDQVKSLDKEFVSTIASYMDVDRFKDYGVDGTAFITSYFDGFDYSIDAITVNDDTARAIVTLTCTSYSDFRSRLNSASSAMAQNAGDYVDMSREDLAKVYGTLLMDTLDEVNLAQTKPMTLTFKRDGDTWKMQENLESEIASFLLTN